MIENWRCRGGSYSLQGLDAMPAPTKLSSSPTIADLEHASKIIKDNLQADAGRVPELDVALVAAGGQH